MITTDTLRIAGCVGLLIWLGDLARQAWVRALEGDADFAGAAYPAWIATGGFLLLAAHLGVNVRRQAGAAAPAAAPLALGARARLVLFVATWLVYVLALPWAGFVVSTFVAMTVSILALGRFNPLITVLASAIFVVTLKVLFITVFYISLPGGYLDEMIVELVFRLTT